VDLELVTSAADPDDFFSGPGSGSEPFINFFQQEIFCKKKLTLNPSFEVKVNIQNWYFYNTFQQKKLLISQFLLAMDRI
jgi:hypothetical protein